MTQPPTQPRRVIPYGHQSISAADREAVTRVLESDWLTQGPAVEAFETALRDYFGCGHAVSCNNGTAALHLAALALEWQPGDVVIVPAITFLATANCAVYVGAEACFADIDDRTFTIDPNEVERHVLRLRAAGRRVRAIVGVDLAGHPCDWVALRALADRYQLQLVDDGCHALGAVDSSGERVGSGRYADLTTLSFHPVKHITTAEGGAVLTRNGELASRMMRLRSHGTVRGEKQVASWEGPWHYDMVDLGYNYRLSDLQAALGTSQMARLPAFVERRRAIADRYRAQFAGFDRLRLPVEVGGARHAYHLFIGRAEFANGMSRRQLFDYCRERGIILQVHYRPVHRNAFYQRYAEARAAESWTPVSRRYYDEAISLPMFPDLSDDDVDYVVSVLREALA